MSLLDGYRALREGVGLLDRSLERGRLRVTGADRRAYLQGLLTNDIAALTAGNGCYSAYLTPQGRMIADLRVFDRGDALLIDLERTVAGTVHDRWTQFIFSEDVQVETITDRTTQLGVYGAAAAAVLEQALGSPPDVLGFSALPMYGSVERMVGRYQAVVLRADDIGVQGFEIVAPDESREALIGSLTAAGAVAAPHEAAEVCRIEAGRPRFHVDMDEDTIPLEAGIEDRAISQTKGCYVGQEVIIRVLHRGHGRVARKLRGLLFDRSEEVPARGTRVLSGDRDIGFVTSAVRSLALDRPIALGYVHRDFLEPGTPVSVGQAAATVSALPFVTDRASHD